MYKRQELQTLAKIISTGKSDSTDTQDKIVDDLKDVLVPTTSEVLWLSLIHI